MTILVTGGAGFIGSSLVDKLLNSGYKVISIDNFDTFYDRLVKEQNIKEHFNHTAYQFIEEDICDLKQLSDKVKPGDVDAIIHLAAKAGVRPSISNPLSYERVNVQGTINLLEFAKAKGIKKFILASSSSVYGVNENIPWNETDLDLKPISPYAASKIAAENYGKVYSSLNDIHVIALRFFTVYGPRQRPDLAIHKFFNLMYKDTPIPFYGDGSTSRDYTYIDDITEGIIGAIIKEKGKSNYEVYNLGNSQPVTLRDLVSEISNVTGKPLKLDELPLQEGDVSRTFSKIEKAKKELSYNPSTSLTEGLNKFNNWFKKMNNLH